MTKVKVGDTFYNFTVIEEVKDESGKLVGRLCLCKCGKTKLIKNFTTVIKGKSKSCGCLRSQLLSTDNPMYRDNVREKVRQAMISDPNRSEIIAKATKAAQTDEVKQRRKQTNLKRYGAISPASNEEVKQKIAETNLSKFGCIAPAQNTLVQEKMESTTFERFGVSNWMKDKNNASYIGQKVKESRRAKGIYRLSNGKLLVDECKKYGVLPTSARNIIKKRGESAFIHWLYSEDKTASSLESDVLKRLTDYGFIVEKFNREVKELKNSGFSYRPDLAVHHNDKTIYLDIDGLYYHSEKRKDNRYHMDKVQAYQACNLNLLQIRQDEIYGESFQILVGLLKSKLGLNKTINGRKTKISEVKQSVAHNFLHNNHMMGAYNGAKHIGLFFNDELILLMSYRKINSTIELSRLCTKVGHTVVGGLSKLLKYIKNVESLPIISFVDLRYADGNGLKKVGFIHESTTLGWKWTDGSFTYDRSFCKANMDERMMTEREHAEEKGLYKIYDAGQAKFILK